MKYYIKRILIDTLGWTFIVFGIVGIFLPILQGMVFLMMGLYLLSLHSHIAYGYLRKFNGWYPKIGARVDRFDTRLRTILDIPLPQ
jgi:hypothetical protein